MGKYINKKLFSAFLFFHGSVDSFAIEKYSLTVEVDADVLIFVRVVWSM